MRRFIVFTIVLCSVLPLLAQSSARFKVIDALDGKPIEKVTVTGDHGLYIGTTDKAGLLPDKAAEQTRISLRHIAYKTLDVTTANCDSILCLEPNAYDIPEVTVSIPARYILYTRSYFRVYQLQDSALVYFKEGFMDTFLGKHSFSVNTIEHNVRTRMFVSPNVERKKNGKIKSDSWLFQIMGPTFIGDRYTDVRADADSTAENEWFQFYRNGQLKECYRRYPDRGITTNERHLNLSKDGDLNLWAIKVAGGFSQFSMVNEREDLIYKSTKDTLKLEDLISDQDRAQVIMQRRGETKEHRLDLYGEVYLLSHKLVTKDQMELLYHHPEPITVKWDQLPDYIPSLPEEIARAKAGMILYKEKDKVDDEADQTLE